jgi:excinuclease UvrABC helicase subunit UvrB
MGKTFDDLFNDFFNRKRNDLTSVNEELRKIISSLMTHKRVENEMLGEAIQSELGKPDEIIEHIEDGMIFKKFIWNTPQGKFVKIVVSDVEEEKQEKVFERKKHSKSLEQRLKEAVEAEDYELAIQLRDEIKKNRKKYRKNKTDE